MTTTFSVIPQRIAHRGVGWVDCSPGADHTAQRFAVRLIFIGKKAGRTIRSQTIVYTTLNRADAEREAAKLRRAAAPAPKRVLGGRFGPLRGKIIAESLPRSAS